jgi:putative peptidoglycan lipid II flippase
MKFNKNSAVTITATMMLLTFGSKIFGFIREMFLASNYGTSYVVDAYVISLNIPQFLFQGILVAVATTFIPVYSKIFIETDRLSADLFTSRTINSLVIISVISSAIGILFSKQLVFIFAHGWYTDPSMLPAIELAEFYVKVTFSAILFSSIAEILDSYQTYYHHYYTPIVTGYLFSISVIIFIMLGTVLGEKWIIVGVIVGYFMRFFVDIFAVRIRKYLHKWDFHLGDSVRKVLFLAIPVFIGTTMEEITVFIDKFMATWLPEGSIAALSYSTKVSGLFVLVIGGMIANYIYPKLSKAFANENYVKWRSYYNKGIRILSMLSIPICFGCLLYSEQIIQLIFERNAFDSTATSVTATVFFFYSISLVFRIPHSFIVYCFYSAHNTRTPVIVSSICAVLNVIGNLLLVRPLGIGGIALSTSIAMAVNVVILFIILNKRNPGLIDRGYAFGLSKMIIAAAIAIAASYPCYYFIANHFMTSGATISHLIPMAVAVVSASLFYLLLLKLFRVRDVELLKGIFLTGHKNGDA